MFNTIKFLTVQKDCRLVIVDSQELVQRELASFSGNQAARAFLEEAITAAVLFGGIHDFHTKFSFLYRFGKNEKIFCEIKQNNLSLEYSEKMNEEDFELESWLNRPAILSITTGDWQTGLHTGTVAFLNKRPGEALTGFSLQSEQLLSEFLISQEQPTSGILLQGMPFVEKSALADIRQQVLQKQELPLANWLVAGEELGRVLWQKKVE